MDIRDILNTIDNLSEGVFDNDEVAAKNVKAQSDLTKWQTDRKAAQEAEINKIKSLINQYSKLKGINYTINESISRELIESFGYNYDDVLQEYSTADFRNDASDFGRGVASGASLGYAPEIAAKIRAATSNVSYDDALKQELAKTDAAKKRSPWLYNAGSVAPSMAIGGPLGWGVAAADLMYGKDDFANPFADDKPTNTKADDQPAPTSDQEPASAKPTNTNNQAGNQSSSADIVSELQTKLVNAGFNVGPSGIDGKFGDKTVAALKKYTASNRLPSDFDAYLKLVSDAANTELKNASVTEAEQIAALRKTLDELDEGKFDTAVNLGKNLFRGISNKSAKGATKSSAEMAADMAKHGFADMYKPVSKADDIAHGLGKSIRGGAILGGKAAAKAAVLGGKAAVFGASLAAKIGGKLSKFASNHKVATLLTGLALYGYTFTPEGNIVATTDTEDTPTQDIKPNTTTDQHGKPDTSANSVDIPTKPSTNSPSMPSPTQTDGAGNTAELSQLASQIDWLIKYASTDTSPELATELDNVKRQWAQLSK